jgi:hypothetical protein
MTMPCIEIQPGFVLHLGIGRALAIPEQRVAIRAGVESLGREHRGIGAPARPARLQHDLVEIRLAGGEHRHVRQHALKLDPERPRRACQEPGLRHHVIVAVRPVQACAAGQRRPSIVRPLTGKVRVADVRPLRKRAIRRVACRAAVTGADAIAIERSDRRLDDGALGLGGRSRDDVDDAVDGVGAPARAARTADDFDPRDVRDEQVLRVPVHAREGAVVDGSSVDQDQ